MKEVKWLQNLLEKSEAGKEVVYRQRGEEKLSIVRSDNGRFVEVYHLHTLILHLDFHAEHGQHVKSVGGAYSLTDSRYINNVLLYFMYAHLYSARIRQGEFQVVFADTNKPIAFN